MRSVAARIFAVAAIAALTCSCTAAQHAGAPAQFPNRAGRGQCAVSKETDVPATMRDGTVLRAESTGLTPPTGTRHPDAHSVRKSGAQAGSRYQPPDWFASHCYLVVIQDVRGQGTSGGTFSEFTHDMEDGYDSVEWAAALPGSNGKVGMYGSSYVGATQWLAAVAAPPHLDDDRPGQHRVGLLRRVDLRGR